MSLEHPPEKHETLLVWDADGDPPRGNWLTVLWKAFETTNDPAAISIPQIVEDRADDLRAQYLTWIHGLGQAQIKGQRLVDWFELRPGFSYWWMTLLAEKSFFKSPQIYDAIRLLALYQLSREVSAKKIILVSSNKELSSTFKRWSVRSNLNFCWKKLSRPRRSVANRLYGLLPFPLQAAAYFAKLSWSRWPPGKQRQQSDAALGRITFFDYLIHLNNSAFSSGRFASNYWTRLVDVLNRSRTNVNWLHLYAPHEAVSTVGRARELVADFNRKQSEIEHHFLLEDELGWRVARAAIRDYLKLFWRSWRARTIARHFVTAQSDLDFWPLFKRDWLNSVRGPTAVWNCLVLSLLEKFVQRLPPQDAGVYLQENQGWEMALIYVWRTARHGRLFGVSHGSSRYWDIRYFYDPKSYERHERNALPMPDQMTINGAAARSTYGFGGYPSPAVIDVEALRYLYLNNDSLRGRHGSAALAGHDVLRVLVCGDVMPQVTKQMMSWLESIAGELPATFSFTVKPHPSCTIKARDYPALSFELTNKPLSELFASFDLVFASNITSAAADAYCSGLPVIQVLDGDSLNMSPLRGLHGVVYVRTAKELAQALLRGGRDLPDVLNEYFCLDGDIPRWRNLLQIAAENCETLVDGVAQHPRSKMKSVLGQAADG